MARIYRFSKPLAWDKSIIQPFDIPEKDLTYEAYRRLIDTDTFENVLDRFAGLTPQTHAIAQDIHKATHHTREHMRDSDIDYEQLLEPLWYYLHDATEDTLIKAICSSDNGIILSQKITQ
ncbi:hypothetical protein EJ419_06285 [Alloscardovia theropitheci]|uniref:Uncharacterized protein n=1 Tax=Alloscardovia theropitheci TaxID=2496842 RepID=A0A4R0QUV8_9BIFI|nr:hypothetical protein [Alloscardovia theropitheci]TCD53857.1 hypothetical protein EJ419_06285 [Alloscardovia theropitheci]